MHAAIKELQDQGYDLPDYPEEPQNDTEADVKARYDRVKGSAVNPVLREEIQIAGTGIGKDVCKEASASMGEWSSDSKSHVAHMQDGDFYSSEQSVAMTKDDTLTVIFKAADGAAQTLVDGLAVESGELVDAATLNKNKLCEFFAEQIASTEPGGLFSLHLKATMMKA